MTTLNVKRTDFYIELKMPGIRWKKKKNENGNLETYASYALAHEAVIQYLNAPTYKDAKFKISQETSLN